MNLEEKQEAMKARLAERKGRSTERSTPLTQEIITPEYVDEEEVAVQAEVAKIEAEQEIVDVTFERHGKAITLKRDKGGKFAARQRTIATRVAEGRKAAQKLRLILSRKDPSTKLTIAEQAALDLLEIIKNGKADPKYAMAAVNAY
jgi:hypothetical protein